ncbi:MAG: rhodoquinone biosynthesis methyltransferase RquA [Gammaproteobacteria bacterium]|nr:rhodoquinone biosynthesis methyltransferase RquA [Gammaproteobacteria bacterium]
MDWLLSHPSRAGGCRKNRCPRAGYPHGLASDPVPPATAAYGLLTWINASSAFVSESYKQEKTHRAVAHRDKRGGMNMSNETRDYLQYAGAYRGAEGFAGTADSVASFAKSAVRHGNDETGALPDYLVRHYWWAYVWPPAVWLFDHQPIINAILFGNYRRITDHTLDLLLQGDPGRTLQIASVYGVLVPTLARHFTPENPLHLIDISPIQLRRARAKVVAAGAADNTRLLQMNAETLRFENNAFDSVLLFLLLHEMPPAARRRTLCEALRVLAPGGRLVLAEYGAFTRTHFLHRWPMRWVFGAAEPFLPSLWHSDLPALVEECAAAVGKKTVVERQVNAFRGFYRVLRLRVAEAE